MSNRPALATSLPPPSAAIRPGTPHRCRAARSAKTDPRDPCWRRSVQREKGAGWMTTQNRLKPAPRI